MEKSPAAPVLALAAACALFAAALPAQAATRLTAGLGFGGSVVPGRWNPLWARCEGFPGEASIQVVLRGADGEARGIESFPCVDGLRLECPVMVDERLYSISVRLVSSGEVLAEEKLAARAKLFPGHLVLVHGEGSRVELALGMALYPSEPVEAVSVSLADLPSSGLGYDGVSALVLRDPGRSIAPAQAAAMAAFIAGGGRVALTFPREGDAGLAGLVSAGGTWREGRPDPYAEIGLGRLVLVGRRLGNGLPLDSEWKDILGLAPYGSARTITASRAFKVGPESFPKEAEYGRAQAILLAALALWAGVSIVAARNRKKSLIPVLATAGAALAFSLAGSASLDSMMRRGARYSSRMLVLPGGTGAIASIGVLSPYGHRKPGALRVDSVRGVEIAYGGTEGGRMLPPGAGTLEWRHELPGTGLSLRSCDEGRLELAGILGAGILAGADIPAGAIAASGNPAPPRAGTAIKVALARSSPEGLAWLVPKGGSWIDEGSTPAWVGLEAAWVESLADLSPGRSFLVGRCALPSLRLSICGAAASEAFWALPLGGEGRS